MAVKVIDEGLKFNGTLQKRTKTDFIILHHAAVSKASIQDIHNYHQKGRGWLGIGYNFYVRKDGSIYQGRPEWAVGAHTTNYNSRSIGICAEGDFEKETMPSAQKQALIELVRELKKKYPNAQIKRHKDFAATACPGKNFPFEEIISEATKPKTNTQEQKDTIYRVQVGAFKDRKNAEKILEQLKKAGFDGFIKQE